MKCEIFKCRIFLILLFLLQTAASGVHASHLIGGHIGYEFIEYNADQSKITYKVSLTGYYDCTSQFWGTGFPEAVLPIKVYEGSYTDNQISFTRNLGLPLVDSARITPNVPDNCSFGFNSCIYLVKFENEVELDVSESGHHFLYDRCCRPPGIQNIHNSSVQAMTYHAWAAPSSGSLAAPNSSPQFYDTLIGYVCVNDTTAILNTVTDPEGDRVEFSIEQPYRGTTGDGNGGSPPPTMNPNDHSPYSFPPSQVIWRAGHSMIMPFGTGGYHHINTQTGLSLFSTSTTGPYVIAVEIKEYRNGKLIGVTRRDMQLLAIDCPGNTTPTFSQITNHPKRTGDHVFTIHEGDSICFPIRYTDADQDNLKMRVQGNLFSSNTTHPPQINLNNSQGDYDEQFCWKAACEEGRDRPYSFVTIATDDGCPPKSRVNAFEINVIPTPDLEKIEGPELFCPGDSDTAFITASPKPDSLPLRWDVQGAQILWSEPDSSSLSIQTPFPGSYTLKATNVNPFGCEGKPATHVIVVSDSLILDLPDLDTLCHGDTMTVQPVNLQTGYSYEWIYGSDQNTGNSYNSKANNSRFIYVTATNSAGCSLTDSTYQHVFPLPPLEVSGDTGICSGTRAVLRAFGTGIINWTPENRIAEPDSFTTTANPRNTTTYTAVLTDSNLCKSSDQLTVSVQKEPDFTAEIDTLLFDGSYFQASLKGDFYGAAIHWSNEENNLCPDCIRQNQLLTFSQEINLNITDALNCFTLDTNIFVEVIDDFEVNIPNAFTPNGDGINDIFIPVYYGIKDIDLFAVFDRWGNKVFETGNIEDGWNGYYKGKLARVNEVYVYKLIARQYNDKKHVYQGKVVVIY